MYAIVKTGGKQYKVEPNQIFEVERLQEEVGTKIELDALMVVNENEVITGTPVVADTKVIVQVMNHGKGVKLHIFKYKPKKRVRTKMGHRQQFTSLKVLEIIKK
ncbi:MAG: 50S ribosomal protein L21 [Clostridia bacterium]|nr:50S ribosomal protein L21 [Clostridia bacterium]